MRLNTEGIQTAAENENQLIETTQEAIHQNTDANTDLSDVVAGMCTENRNFLKVKLGNREYKALYDPGATISLVNATIAEEFRDRIEPAESVVESAMGTAYKCLGKLKVKMVIDGVIRDLNVTALDCIKHDIILSMDFIKLFDIETRREQTEWRVGELRLQNGTWQRFCRTGRERVNVFAECAGICELEPGERKILDQLVETILGAEGGRGLTSRIQHEIKLKPNAKPVRQAPRRLSPKILEAAQEEVDRMLQEDIIEKSEEQSSRAEAELQEVIEKQGQEVEENRFLSITQTNIETQEPMKWDQEDEGTRKGQERKRREGTNRRDWPGREKGRNHITPIDN